MKQFLIQANNLKTNSTNNKAAETHIEINPFIAGGVLNRIDNILLDIKRKTGFWFIFTNYVREFFGGTNLKIIFDTMVMDLRNLKENLKNNPLSFENVSVELRQLEAIGLNKVGKNSEGIKSKRLDKFREVINPLISDIKMQFIIGQRLTIKEFVQINGKLNETLSLLDQKINEIIKEKHINGILNLIERTILAARQNLVEKYKEIKSKNMENLPFNFRRGYLSKILKSKSFEVLPLINQSEEEMAEWHLRAKEKQGKYAHQINTLLKFFEEINFVISTIESGIETGMRSSYQQSNKGLLHAFNENYLTSSVKQFEQIYLYSLFARVIFKFYFILNKLVSSKVLNNSSSPDEVELFYLWILRSEIIVPFMERINEDGKIYGDKDQRSIDNLLSQTLQVFWELNKRYKIEDITKSLQGSFTHEVVLSKVMELPQAYYVPRSNGSLFYQMYILRETFDKNVNT